MKNKRAGLFFVSFLLITFSCAMGLTSCTNNASQNTTIYQEEFAQGGTPILLEDNSSLYLKDEEVTFDLDNLTLDGSYSLYNSTNKDIEATLLYPYNYNLYTEDDSFNQGYYVTNNNVRVDTSFRYSFGYNFDYEEDYKKVKKYYNSTNLISKDTTLYHYNFTFDFYASNVPTPKQYKFVFDFDHISNATPFIICDEAASYKAIEDNELTVYITPNDTNKQEVNLYFPNIGFSSLDDISVDAYYASKELSNGDYFYTNYTKYYITITKMDNSTLGDYIEAKRSNVNASYQISSMDYFNYIFDSMDYYYGDNLFVLGGQRDFSLNNFNRYLEYKISIPRGNTYTNKVHININNSSTTMYLKSVSYVNYMLKSNISTYRTYSFKMNIKYSKYVLSRNHDLTNNEEGGYTYQSTSKENDNFDICFSNNIIASTIHIDIDELSNEVLAIIIFTGLIIPLIVLIILLLVVKKEEDINPNKIHGLIVGQIVLYSLNLVLLLSALFINPVVIIYLMVINLEIILLLLALERSKYYGETKKRIVAFIADIAVIICWLLLLKNPITLIAFYIILIALGINNLAFSIRALTSNKNLKEYMIVNQEKIKDCKKNRVNGFHKGKLLNGYYSLKGFIIEMTFICISSIGYIAYLAYIIITDGEIENIFFGLCVTLFVLLIGGLIRILIDTKIFRDYQKDLDYDKFLEKFKNIQNDPKVNDETKNALLMDKMQIDFCVDLEEFIKTSLSIKEPNYRPYREKYFMKDATILMSEKELNKAMIIYYQNHPNFNKGHKKFENFIKKNRIIYTKNSLYDIRPYIKAKNAKKKSLKQAIMVTKLAMFYRNIENMPKCEECIKMLEENYSCLKTLVGLAKGEDVRGQYEEILAKYTDANTKECECPSCHYMNKANSKFCIKCGNAISSKEEK